MSWRSCCTGMTAAADIITAIIMTMTAAVGTITTIMTTTAAAGTTIIIEHTRNALCNSNKKGVFSCLHSIILTSMC